MKVTQDHLGNWDHEIDAFEGTRVGCHVLLEDEPMLIISSSYNDDGSVSFILD